MNNNHQATDVPFHFRHCCWFCNEPAAETFAFPNRQSIGLESSHPAIFVASCQECKRFANQVYGHSIWQCREKVKKALIKRYQKDLAIGKNWTKEELANSEFSGGNFEGFAKSGWFIYEVARDRVNFAGWPLHCNGQEISDSSDGLEFIFDGVTYADLSSAIEFYVKTYYLEADFLLKIINIVGEDRFADAIRFARLYIGYSRAAQNELLGDLKLRN